MSAQRRYQISFENVPVGTRVQFIDEQPVKATTEPDGSRYIEWVHNPLSTTEAQRLKVRKRVPITLNKSIRRHQRA